MRRNSAGPRYLFLLAALAAIVPAGASGALAQSREASARLEKTERALDAGRAERRDLQRQSATLQKELDTLRTEMERAAAASQEQEALLTRLEAQLDALDEDLRVRRAALKSDHRRLAKVLRTMSAVAYGAPESALLLKGDPRDAVRAATVLRAAAPRIDRRIHDLASEVSGLVAVKQDIAGKREEVRHARENLETSRARLSRLVEQKAALVETADDAVRRSEKSLKTLAAEARSLRELVERLEKEGAALAAVAPSTAAPAAPEDLVAVPAPPADKPQRAASIRDFPDQGGVTTPASGSIVRHFGDNSPAGGTTRGVTFATRPDAQVVAPFDGKVAFAGPFRGHGLILIIEHRGGYHTLLAGMARIDAAVGQWLLAGEPVGAMGAAGGELPNLYVELRRNGQPINPMRWMASASNKVRG